MSTKGMSVPVGCVLPYAGLLNNNQLNALGWSVCNGALLRIDLYQDLFDAIGTCNGGDGNVHFNIPDYQGYFLRGVDTSGAVDKGAAGRTAPASGAASGATVGSIEGYATACPTPKAPFQASVPHVPTDSHDAYSGTNAAMLETGSAQTFYSNAGGDAETRPVNAYVNFIIKLAPDAGLPTGVVAPYAGNEPGGSPTLGSSYLVCDGSSQTQGKYQVLFDAIGTAHGGSASIFNLPDYRGRFLRGAANGTNRDPDRDARVRMAPGGNTGDLVGSIQDYATAKPVKPFQITFNLGNSNKESDHCAGHDNSMWNAGSADVTFTASGGDHETRPVNVAVDHYIFAGTDPNDGDLFPVGAVIGFPGNALPPDDQWMLCDGSSLSNKQQYATLFAAIAYTNGGDGTAHFNLPNYQGYFLRGANRGQKIDPDAASRTAAAPGGQTGDNVGSLQGFATARPKSKDITGAVAHLPTTDADTAAAVLCSEVAEWDGAQAPTVGGGDLETRPLNANILFYIKYATASG